MSPRRTVLIVGAGLAGSRCAETLRAEGFDGRIVLAGEEPHAPYERPALSKELLVGRKAPESLALRPEGFWAEHEIDLLPATRVVRVDGRVRTAVTDAGRVLPWDSLVLATGARARTLLDAPPGVHVLRTLDDALALRQGLDRGRRFVVVGAGFIGGEAATSAAALGLDVTVLEAAPVPLGRVLGDEAGRLLADRYREHGIRLLTGAGLAGFRRGPQGRLCGLLREGGDEIRCDIALLGIGAEPVSPPGVPAGGDGIPTDACGRTAFPGVYACGDVASTLRPALGRRVRVEHWTSAAGQGAAVARAILGRDEPHDEPPFFWSDQLGLRLQYVGHAGGDARAEIEGTPGSFAVRYRDADGRLVAALLANRPREAASLRRELAA